VVLKAIGWICVCEGVGLLGEKKKLSYNKE
jgi:hypothetical protein